MSRSGRYYNFGGVQVERQDLEPLFGVETKERPEKTDFGAFPELFQVPTEILKDLTFQAQAKQWRLMNSQIDPGLRSFVQNFVFSRIVAHGDADQGGYYNEYIFPDTQHDSQFVIGFNYHKNKNGQDYYLPFIYSKDQYQKHIEDSHYQPENMLLSEDAELKKQSQEYYNELFNWNVLELSQAHAQVGKIIFDERLQGEKDRGLVRNKKNPVKNGHLRFKKKSKKSEIVSFYASDNVTNHDLDEAGDYSKAYFVNANLHHRHKLKKMQALVNDIKTKGLDGKKIVVDNKIFAYPVEFEGHKFYVGNNGAFYKRTDRRNKRSANCNYPHLSLWEMVNYGVFEYLKREGYEIQYPDPPEIPDFLKSAKAAENSKKNSYEGLEMKVRIKKNPIDLQAVYETMPGDAVNYVRNWPRNSLVLRGVVQDVYGDKAKRKGVKPGDQVLINLRPGKTVDDLKAAAGNPSKLKEVIADQITYSSRQIGKSAAKASSTSGRSQSLGRNRRGNRDGDGISPVLAAIRSLGGSSPENLAGHSADSLGGSHNNGDKTSRGAASNAGGGKPSSDPPAGRVPVLPKQGQGTEAIPALHHAEPNPPSVYEVNSNNPYAIALRHVESILSAAGDNNISDYDFSNALNELNGLIASHPELSDLRDALLNRGDDISNFRREISASSASRTTSNPIAIDSSGGKRVRFEDEKDKKSLLEIIQEARSHLRRILIGVILEGDLNDEDRSRFDALLDDLRNLEGESSTDPDSHARAVDAVFSEILGQNTNNHQGPDINRVRGRLSSFVRLREVGKDDGTKRASISDLIARGDDASESSDTPPNPSPSRANTPLTEGQQFSL